MASKVAIMIMRFILFLPHLAEVDFPKRSQSFRAQFTLPEDQAARVIIHFFGDDLNFYTVQIV
jgi:hypothetical protein